jgi:hypothetical protein
VAQVLEARKELASVKEEARKVAEIEIAAGEAEGKTSHSQLRLPCNQHVFG